MSNGGLSSVLFGAVCIAAVTIIAFGTFGGATLAPWLAAEHAEGVGFLVVTCYFATMLPIQVAVLKLTIEPTIPLTNVGALLAATRQRRWPIDIIYLSLTLQVFVAAIGFGVALSAAPIAGFLAAVVVLSGRFVIARACLEARQCPHLMQYPLEAPELAYPHTGSERWMNRLADVPLIAVMLAAYAVTHHALWILGASLILSYSFLVRYGHHADDRGPVGYVATILALGWAAVLLWPIAVSKLRGDTGILDFAFGVGTLVYVVVAAADRSVPLKKRAINLAFAALLLCYYTYHYLFSGETDLSRAVVFGPWHWTTEMIWSLVSAFSLPICLYTPLTAVADKLLISTPSTS